MAIAWWLIFAQSETISKQLIEDGRTTAASIAISLEDKSDQGYLLRNRLLDTELMMRSSQNTYAVIVVSTSLAFSLLAIGFALFVMGADGAFRIEGAAQEKGSVVLQATAPGLLCFLLAGIIVINVLSTEMVIQPSGYGVKSSTDDRRLEALNTLSNAPGGASNPNCPEGAPPPGVPKPEGCL
tara:strand:+ start:1575 stop:2123 length:549 start_codon:yes stop_codon:yes gene_type:complete